MKQLAFFAGVVLLASCSNQDNANKQADSLKAQQQTADSINMEAMKRHTIDSMNMEATRQRTIDSMNQVAAAHPKVIHERTRVVEHTTNNYTTGATNSGEAYSKTTATTTKKKGWTGATKGAIIGAGVGAVSGALIDGNKAEGALVGGALGAGAGAGTGAIIDKANKKKNKE